MKLVLFQVGQAALVPGLLTERGVIDISSVTRPNHTPQLVMEGIIDDFERLRPALAKLERDAVALPLSSVRLRPTLPRPHKILCALANYWEHAQRAPRPLNMFMKNPDAVIGPGDTIQLPAYTDPWIFMHEAELALVIKGPSKSIKRENWRDAVFGYTCFVDVTARGEGRRTWPASLPMSWLGKSFDTFCSARAVHRHRRRDREIPTTCWCGFWNDGQLRHNYNTDDMEHRVPELVEFATTVMTLLSGDIIACGTNHEGLGALQDGETIEIEIQGIGRMPLKVADPLKRTWERGVYMGADSTNPEAVKRNRPRHAGAGGAHPENPSP